MSSGDTAAHCLERTREQTFAPADEDVCVLHASGFEFHPLHGEGAARAGQIDGHRSSRFLSAGFRRHAAGLDVDQFFAPPIGQPVAGRGQG